MNLNIGSLIMLNLILRVAIGIRLHYDAFSLLGG